MINHMNVNEDNRPNFLLFNKVNVQLILLHGANSITVSLNN